MISTSPLRYPGGKARFTNFIWSSIEASGEQPEIFIEPFCGGAGTGLALMELNKVSRIALNDFDPYVASFWKIVFGKTQRPKQDINWLLSTIESTDVSIDEWRKQKSLRPTNIREAAWKCFFLNRTSFNGIIHKAGPIGGWEQKNRTLDVRFNREKLLNRIITLYEQRERVERVTCANWKPFLNKYSSRNSAYIYLDPPYYNRAEQLYGYLFNTKDHIKMRDYLINLQIPWMLSYDDAPEVRTLYNDLKSIHGRVIDQTYSAHPVGGASFIGRELFFSNRNLPVHDNNKLKKPHVGLSIIGCFREIKSESHGPIRIPTNLPSVISA